jgi:hypothetical protein
MSSRPGDDDSAPTPEALYVAVGEAVRHQTGLPIWQAQRLGPPKTIAWTVHQLDPLPAIAIHDQARVTVGDHDIITLNPVTYPIVREPENHQKTQ